MADKVLNFFQIAVQDARVYREGVVKSVPKPEPAKVLAVITEREPWGREVPR